MDDLQQLLDAIAAKGLRVRILAEREIRVHAHLPEPTKWEWWCELQHGNGHKDSDHGGTMFTALSNAFERAQGKRGPDNRPMDNTVIVTRKATAKGVRVYPGEAVMEMPEMDGMKLKSAKIKTDLSFLD